MSDEEKRRTALQNRSLHKWCELMAIALNDAGLDMKAVLFGRVEQEVMEYLDTACPIIKDDVQGIFDSFQERFDLPWTKTSVKDSLWRPVQIAMMDKESTTELETVDPSVICDTLNRHFSEKHGVYVPWPSRRG